jgi:tRNA dimethylallyltransferase
MLYFYMTNKVLVLLGPTSVGKSGAAILLAKELGSEIISADSMQVYKRMDIGTAKPSPEELKEVPHHMISIIEPWEEFSAGKFIEEVVPIIERLHSEGKIPVVVGGTGLYIKSMTRGLFASPSANTILREELLAEEEEEPGALYGLLLELDPETAKTLTAKDTRRLVRALEVTLQSSAPVSTVKKSLTSPLPYDFIKLGISREREELYYLIEKRVDRMMEAGLLEEARKVLSMNPSKTAMQAIGYKELAGFLNGEYPLEEAVRLIKRNTKRYAKRQFTWFKKEENISWIDATWAYEPREIYLKLRGKLLQRDPAIFP